MFSFSFSRCCLVATTWQMSCSECTLCRSPTISDCGGRWCIIVNSICGVFPSSNKWLSCIGRLFSCCRSTDTRILWTGRFVTHRRCISDILLLAAVRVLFRTARRAIRLFGWFFLRRRLFSLGLLFHVWFHTIHRHWLCYLAGCFSLQLNFLRLYRVRFVAVRRNDFLFSDLGRFIAFLSRIFIWQSVILQLCFFPCTLTSSTALLMRAKRVLRRRHIPCAAERSFRLCMPAIKSRSLITGTNLEFISIIISNLSIFQSVLCEEVFFLICFHFLVVIFSK